MATPQLPNSRIDNDECTIWRAGVCRVAESSRRVAGRPYKHRDLRWSGRRSYCSPSTAHLRTVPTTRPRREDARDDGRPVWGAERLGTSPEPRHGCARTPSWLGFDSPSIHPQGRLPALQSPTPGQARRPAEKARSRNRHHAGGRSPVVYRRVRSRESSRAARRRPAKAAVAHGRVTSDRDASRSPKPRRGAAGAERRWPRRAVTDASLPAICGVEAAQYQDYAACRRSVRQTASVRGFL